MFYLLLLPERLIHAPVPVLLGGIRRNTVEHRDRVVQLLICNSKPDTTREKISKGNLPQPCKSAEAFSISRFYIISKEGIISNGRAVKRF